MSLKSGQLNSILNTFYKNIDDILVLKSILESIDWDETRNLLENWCTKIIKYKTDTEGIKKD